MMKSIYHFLRSAGCQITTVLVVSLYITGLHVWQYKRTLYMESYQPILAVEEPIKQLASLVTVGLYVNNFPTFSFGKNDFVLDGVVSFRFPLGTECLKTIDDFSFCNGDITYKSKPMLQYNNDDVIVAYQVRVEFKTYLDYSAFPVGDHRLTIMLDNRNVTPHEVIFQAADDDFELSGDLLVATWLPVRKNVQAGYVKSVLNRSKEGINISYPRVIFTIDFENNSAAELITLYFPLFVLFFIGFCSLLFPLQATKRFEVIAAAMPILVLDKLVIDSVSPTFFGMTKIDFAYFVLVFLSSLILLFQSYVLLTVRNCAADRQEVVERKFYTLEVMTLVVFYGILLGLAILLTWNALIS
jgi:hypothetical protein